MGILTYLAELIRDNLATVALAAILFVALSPYQIWKLLTNNRPGRDSGWRMWLADRYIQVWLAGKPLDSSNAQFDLRMPSGLGDTVFYHSITRKVIDEKLEKYWLVRRSGDTVTARRDVYLYICNWLTYFFCKWYLILLCGDSTRYYENLAQPPSRVHKIFRDAAKEGFVRLLKFFGMLALLFITLKAFAWGFPYFVRFIEVVFSHIEIEAPQFPQN